MLAWSTAQVLLALVATAVKLGGVQHVRQCLDRAQGYTAIKASLHSLECFLSYFVLMRGWVAATGAL
jgi:hypothetical protein